MNNQPSALPPCEHHYVSTHQPDFPPGVYWIKTCSFCGHHVVEGRVAAGIPPYPHNRDEPCNCDPGTVHLWPEVTQAALTAASLAFFAMEFEGAPHPPAEQVRADFAAAVHGYRAAVGTETAVAPSQEARRAIRTVPEGDGTGEVVSVAQIVDREPCPARGPSGQHCTEPIGDHQRPNWHYAEYWDTSWNELGAHQPDCRCSTCRPAFYR